MDIASVKPITPTYTPSTNNSGQAENTTSNGNTEKLDEKVAPDVKNQEPRNIHEVSEELNKFLELADADLRFKLHEKTGRLMVQFVDIKNDKVLKEFPPHEMLDILAKIRDYIGALLDKKI